MYSPRVFSKLAGVSYARVQQMVKEGKLQADISPKGHVKIYESELAKIKVPAGYVSEEEYQRVLMELADAKNKLMRIQDCIGGKQ